MENMLENRFKLKKDETSKIVLLKFENQIHTHFPGKSKEFIKDENSPTKRTVARQSQLDPIQIQASMSRKDQFFKEGELLQLFKSFEAEYGKRVGPPPILRLSNASSITLFQATWHAWSSRQSQATCQE